MKKKILLLSFILTFTVSLNAKTIDPVTPQVLTNHLGYDPIGSKRAVILGFKADTFKEFKILDYQTKKEVLTGKITKEGTVDKWKNWHFWTIDFSSLKTEGKYYIETISNGKNI